jgi:hypothetical protein
LGTVKGSRLSTYRLVQIIGATSEDHGTVTPSGDIPIPPGESQGFTIKPDAGYAVGGVFVDNVSVGAVTEYKLDTIDSDHWIYAFFTQNSYTINSSATTGGFIDPQGSVVVDGGVMHTFSLTPAAGYTMGPVNGNCGGIVNTQTLTFSTSKVSRDCSVEATFVTDSSADNHFLVSPFVSNVAGGTIDPATSQSVADGGVITFTLVPQPGYTVGLITGSCGGVFNTQKQIFTTFAVSQNCTIEATFVSDVGETFVIQSSAGDGGTISPDGSHAVVAGEVVTFDLLPNEGYELGPVVGSCPGVFDSMAKTYTTQSVSQDCTVEATFVDGIGLTHDVTTFVVGKGTMTPSDYQEVADGGVVSYTLHPAPYTSIASVSGCNGVRSDKSYVTGPIIADCEIVAAFAPVAYSLTVIKTGRGALRGSIEIDLQQDLACVDSSCTGMYAGTVSLTPVVKGTDRFEGWSGCSSVTGITCTIEMNGDQGVTANFYSFPWHLFRTIIRMKVE